MGDLPELRAIATACKIHIDGQELPPVPGNQTRIYMVRDKKNRLCVNGYEWKRGKWRRTLRAIWNYWF